MVGNEMEVLLTEERTITVGGREITVTPYSWADTFRLAKPFGVVFSAISTHIDAFIEATSVVGESALGQMKAVSDVVMGMDNFEEVIDALSEMVVKSTSLTKEEVETLKLDEFIQVGMVVYEVNKTFFTERLTPTLKKVMGETEEETLPQEK